MWLAAPRNPSLEKVSISRVILAKITLQGTLISATIFEAKTNLSELVKKAQNGEVVIITSGRNKTPVARIEAIHPKAKAPGRAGNAGLQAAR